MTGLSGNRLKLLRALVKVAEFRSDTGVSVAEVGEETGIPHGELGAIENWLTDRGLLEGLTFAHVSVTALAIDVIEDLEGQAMKQGEAESERDRRKVFVIYGRNTKAFEAMRDFLRALGLQAADFSKLVAETGTAPFVGHVVRDGLRSAQAMIALCTPDERAVLLERGRDAHDSSSDVERLQPRPNVLLEMGMALGIDEDRTIVVTLGKVDMPSDIAGRHLLRMSDSVEARDDLKRRLGRAGCLLSEDSDWSKAGRFDASIAEAEHAIPTVATTAVEAALAPDAIRMRLIAWLKKQDRQSEAATGHPIEFARIDAEAKVPTGSTAEHLTAALCDDWLEVERGGGCVIFKRRPSHVVPRRHDF